MSQVDATRVSVYTEEGKEGVAIVDVKEYIRRPVSFKKIEEDEEENLLEDIKKDVKALFHNPIPSHIRQAWKDNEMRPSWYDMGKWALNQFSLPYFPWANASPKKYLQFLYDDIFAGITVAIVLVPQGLAYAQLGSLPPIYGLYAATIAGYVYALFGTSGQLTIGPVALVSLFMTETFEGIGVSMAKDDYSVYVRTQMAAVVSFAVGILLIGLAFIKIGGLMRFVSPSVMTGFVTGSGCYIALTQIKQVFGVTKKVPKTAYNIQEFQGIWKLIRAQGPNPALTIGWTALTAMLVVMIAKRLIKPKPQRKKKTWYKIFKVFATGSTLLIIILSTIWSYYLIQGGSKVPHIGYIPPGFNTFEFPPLNTFFPFQKVLVRSIPVTFLSYMESVSVARKYALAHRYALDNTQELWALGLGSFAASFFSTYPPGGSFSRTALKAEVGVKTPLANVFTSLAVTLVLVAFTKTLFYVPMAVLGAVIVTAIMSLFDFGEMWHAMFVAPLDFLVMIFTFGVTFFWNIEKGLIYGLIASVFVLIYQMTKLDVESVGELLVGRAPTKDLNQPPHFRPLNQLYPNAQPPSEDIMILRLTANLFFGNVSIFRDQFYDRLGTDDCPVRAVVVDTQGVPQLDLTSLAVLDELKQETRKRNIKLYFAGARDRLIKTLFKAGLLECWGGSKVVGMSVEDVYMLVRQWIQEENDVKEGKEEDLDSEALLKNPVC